MSQREHFATLDGMRGLAALVVVIMHALYVIDLGELLTPHGQLAVDFFFCLSGFVIGHAYEKKLLTTMSFSDFAATRIIRLYPLIIVGLLLGCTVYAVRAGLLHHQNPFTPPFLSAAFLEVFLIPLPPMLGPDWEGVAPLNVPAWSLFYEFFANFLYAVFITKLTKPVMTFLLALGTIIIFAQNYMFDGLTLGFPTNNFKNFGRVFYPFLCGVFLFRCWQTGSFRHFAKLAPFTPLALLAILLLPVPSDLKWIYESLAVVVAFPLIISAGALDTPGPRTKTIYLLLGRLSYPMYILSFPLIRPFTYFARAHNFHGFGLFLMIIAQLLFAMGFAFVMVKYFDEPLRKRLSHKWRTRPQTSLSAASIP